MAITPFEKNIEVWKQLWRVIEKSHVLLQIVDARNPYFFYSADLEKYISALELAKDGKTSPGQSTSTRHLASFSRGKVWKCFVLPGIAATPTLFLPQRTLIKDDFPTLGYPTVPTFNLSL